MTADEFNLALKSLGLRQRELAESLGVHRSTVNHWSRGKMAVPQYAALCLSLMQKIADGIKGTSVTICDSDPTGNPVKARPIALSGDGRTVPIEGEMEAGKSYSWVYNYSTGRAWFEEVKPIKWEPRK